MARDEAYYEAEKLIEEARRSGTKNLSLSSMKLTELPESIGQLTQLQKLFLHDNQLTALPEALKQLRELQELNLYNNNVREISPWIWEFKSLKTLIISANQLADLPETSNDLSLEWLTLGFSEGGESSWKDSFLHSAYETTENFGAWSLSIS